MSRHTPPAGEPAAPDTPCAPGAEPELMIARDDRKDETLTGTVEHACGRTLLHLGDGRGVQLLGGDRHTLVDGARVTVEGRRSSGAATTSQDAEPFRVFATRPA